MADLNLIDMEILTTSRVQSFRLIYLGEVLFLLGLLVGLIVPLFANPRMGVSSHLDGIFNGMFLIVLGLIWERLRLSARGLRVAYWLALYGTFMNWLSILVAAIFDAGQMLNVVAEGEKGPALAEAFVTFGLISLSLAMIVVTVLVLIGLSRGMKTYLNTR